MTSNKFAGDTEHFKRMEALFQAVGKPLKKAVRRIHPWGPRDERGDQDVILRELNAAAQNLVDNLEIHFERESREKAFRKGYGRKITNIRKLYTAWAKARTWDDLKAVIEKQTTKSKDAWDKHVEGGGLFLDMIRALDREDKGSLTVDNFQVRLVSHPGAEWDDKAVGKLQWILREAGKLLSSRGFPKLAKGTVFAIPAKRISGGVMATYNLQSHIIQLAIGGSADQVVQSMIHELGHAQYFEYMGGRGRAAWEQFFGDNVGDPDVDGLIRVWENWSANETDFLTKKYGRYTTYFLDWVKKKDPDMAMWTEILMQELDIKEPQSYSGFKRGTVPGLDQLIALKGKAKAFLYPVTAYSATSPEELYAESFAHYIVRGPNQLPSILKDTFLRATPSAKMASMKTANRVAARYVVKAARQE